MSCSTFYPSGIGACKSFRERVMGVILVEKGNSKTVAESKLLATYLTLMADKSAGVKAIYIPFDRGYQNNSAEPEITTSNLGFMEKTNDTAPAIKGFGYLSYEDYKTFFGADNQEFDFLLVQKDGVIEGTKTSTGKIKGYRGKLFVQYNAPMADNLQESYPFTISFTDVNEWKVASTTIVPTFSITDLVDSIPVGLQVEIVTAYTAGVVIVKVTKRNQSKSPYVGLTTVAKWEVLSSSELLTAITVVDAASAGLGLYGLTIKQGAAPANLSEPVVIRGADDNATIYTYLTQPLTVNV